MTDYYDDYFFTSNTTGFQCPNIDFQCTPTSACARDPATGARYCCSDQNRWCWTAARPCATDGSTRDCGAGDVSWCCLQDTEICTTGKNQINICFNNVPTTLLNISSNVLNETFSSLSSASPGATSYTFTPSVLIAETRTGSSSTTATGSSSSSSSSSSSPTNSSASSGSHASSSHLSGGAIAGIVIGCVAVLALILAAALFLLRRRRNVETAQGIAQSEDMAKIDLSKELPDTARPSELQAHGSQFVVEMHTPNERPVELPGNE